MVDQDRPRVKLPDHIIRKPVVPGLNSWAQAQQQQQQHSAYDQKSSVAVTNRDKYEDKPMPPPPPDEISPPRLQPRTYIQPAIPLVNQVPISKTPKNRAVTDPVAPRPLFAGRKISVNQLRKKCSTSKGKAEAPKDEGKDDGDPTTSARLPSENAAQVLGLYLVQDNKRNTPPPSAPTSKVPDPFRISYEDPPERNDTPARQVQSTPVPTRRYLTENGLPTSTLIEPSNASQRQVNEPGPNKHDQTRDTDDQAPVNGMLRPPKVGAFVNFGEIGVVQENVMHRIDSFRGIIEDAGPTNGYGDHTATTSSEAPSQLGTDRGQDSRNILVSSMYTPGNYGGVWENDPAVGYSLPPFSPMPHDLPPKEVFNGRGRSQQPSNTTCRENFGSYPSARPSSVYGPSPDPNINRFPDYQHPFPSANSWASESQGNSFMSTNPPLSALLPPRWPHHHISNSVPSPPQNQNDFQRSGSISAALSQIEITLHHHIDSSSGSLSRLITDKHDRAMDQTLRRLENLEDTVGKGLRNLKGEVREIRRDVSNLHGDLNHVVKGNERITELIEELKAKLQTLDSHVEEHACRCQSSATEHTPSDPGSDRQQRYASHRRTESAHGALGHSEQRKQHQRGASRPSKGARQSASGSRGHRSRSNTLSSQPANRISDERSTMREYFAELGATRGKTPDLRDHPAYAGVQQDQARGYEQDQHGMVKDSPYENPSPSLSDGRWYQQAYGQNH